MSEKKSAKGTFIFGVKLALVKGFSPEFLLLGAGGISSPDSEVTLWLWCKEVLASNFGQGLHYIPWSKIPISSPSCSQKSYEHWNSHHLAKNLHLILPSCLCISSALVYFLPLSGYSRQETLYTDHRTNTYTWGKLCILPMGWFRAPSRGG